MLACALDHEDIVLAHKPNVGCKAANHRAKLHRVQARRNRSCVRHSRANNVTYLRYTSCCFKHDACTVTEEAIAV